MHVLQDRQNERKSMINAAQSENDRCEDTIDLQLGLKFSDEHTGAASNFEQIDTPILKTQGPSIATRDHMHFK